MTSNVILFYYSRKGNTKAIVNLFDNICIVEEIQNIRNYDLDKFSTIIFATSTYGRGIPPQEFFNIKDILVKLKGKSIGLFGSGNTHYEYFCGALDLLEIMLEKNNNIIFKYGYEGYPKQINIENMEEIIYEKIIN